MRIQHNIMAMSAYRNYNNNTSAVAKNLEKLSSGYKINRAGDDAAGLAISEKMRAQITGLNAAQKNVKDGISLVKTAEGALQEVQDMMNRMYKLSVQSANGTFDNEVDRANLQQEVDALKEEIDRIADSSNFNGIKLLDGSLGARDATLAGNMANGIKNIQVFGGGSGAPTTAASFGASVGAGGAVTFTPATVTGVTWEAVGSETVGKNGGTITYKAVIDKNNTTMTAADRAYYEGMSVVVTVDAAKADGTWDATQAKATGIGAAKGLDLQIGDTSDDYNQMTVTIKDMHVAALGIAGVNIGSQSDAQGAVDVLKAAINEVSKTRGTLGAAQNRLEHTQNNLSVMEENIQDAEATIRDTDVAKEMMSYTKNNILVQSAQAMLAQANQVPQGVLQLLG